jgi:hypothetical protein
MRSRNSIGDATAGNLVALWSWLPSRCVSVLVGTLIESGPS